MRSMNLWRSVIIIAAALAAGLQAGTYYIWACAIIPGVARADDRTFVTVLNHLNHAIVNPVFMLTFLGTPVLAAVAAVLADASSRPWVVVALVLSVATLVVTFAANIPLNNALDAGADAPTAARAAFETGWQRWNRVRVATSAGALVALAVALLRA